MTYSYDQGSASVANAFGRLKVAGIQSNDKGTFITHKLTGLNGSPPVRLSGEALDGEHGETYDKPFSEPRDILWEFAVQAATVQDMWDAIDDLKMRVNIDKGLLDYEVEFYNQPVKTFKAHLSGEIDITEPDPGQGRVPWREIAIPLRAPDPRLYGLTTYTVAIGTSGTALSHLGNTPAPTIFRFHGADEDPYLTDPDATWGGEITTDITLGSGNFIELDSKERTAIRSTDGGNVRSNILTWSDLEVQPTIGSFWVRHGSGVQQAIFRDTWLT